jgi:RNA polymerase sigma-70 factor (ECF subfamily)
LLTIVRNTCFTWLARRGHSDGITEFNEEMHSPGSENPESLLLREADSRLLAEALQKLPAEFREAIVLRELENMSYKEISEVAGVPIGTVMSRLARARQRLQEDLASPGRKEG